MPAKSMPPKATKPASKRKYVRKAKPKVAEKIKAAKASVKTAAPPSKRAELLKRAYPELADPAWVKGNKAAAEKLEA